MSPSPTTVFERVFRPGPATDHVPLPASGRAGRNLPAAVTTAVVLAGLVALTLLLAPPAFVGLVVVLCLGAVWELAGAFARVGVRVAVPPAYVGAIGIPVCAWALGLEGTLFALFLTIFAVIVWVLADTRSDAALTDVVTSVFVVVYVPFLASFVISMLVPAHTPWAVLAFVAVTISNDIGGWAAGVLFGKHPMSPRISPHKSWEGFAGSVLLCSAVGVGVFQALGAPWWWGLLAGVAAALVGTIGDLTESMVKREVGLKDMSNLLPGHGGILDRIDSLLMVAPVLYLFFRLSGVIA